jgi:hypothetical protein
VGRVGEKVGVVGCFGPRREKEKEGETEWAALEEMERKEKGFAFSLKRSNTFNLNSKN